LAETYQQFGTGIGPAGRPDETERIVGACRLFLA
jgi:hypothetical protein